MILFDKSDLFGDISVANLVKASLCSKTFMVKASLNSETFTKVGN